MHPDALLVHLKTLQFYTTLYEVVKGIREAIALLVASSNYSPPKQTPQKLDERQYQVTSPINEADRLRENKKFEEAALKYKAALNLDPNSAYAYNCLGIALSNQGKLDEAIAELEIAVHLDLSSTLFRDNLEIYRNKKKGFWGHLFG
ncbi:TPR repeat-containing protein [Tolypothrix sp. NIES-4075]|uniref:tetratricopeptide repeat protein n=1 Tax=Tolypothrix sp. NIES-4075 TaxID=2005459 RepID=UPI000B5C83A5|nr:tetratricopeptide repeat protein [Tolypothrix sp. NIES-4075]GAX44868.1 TPR repeat-containing protein [Tolypothrix sp. NIES-4075]